MSLSGDSVLYREVKFLKKYRNTIEFEVYGPTPDHTELMSEAEMIDDSAVRTAVREINNYLKRKEIYAPHINGLYNALALAVDNYKNPPVSSPEEPSSEPSSTKIISRFL